MTGRSRSCRLLAALLVVGVAGGASAQNAAPREDFVPQVGQAGKDVVWVPTPDVLVDQMLRRFRRAIAAVGSKLEPCQGVCGDVAMPGPQFTPGYCAVAVLVDPEGVFQIAQRHIPLSVRQPASTLHGPGACQKDLVTMRTLVALSSLSILPVPMRPGSSAKAAEDCSCRHK